MYVMIVREPCSLRRDIINSLRSLLDRGSLDGCSLGVLNESLPLSLSGVDLPRARHKQYKSTLLTTRMYLSITTRELSDGRPEPGPPPEFRAALLGVGSEKQHGGCACAAAVPSILLLPASRAHHHPRCCCQPPALSLVERPRSFLPDLTLVTS